MKEGINKILHSKSKTFLAFCFCFIISAGLASLFDLPAVLKWYLYYLVCALISALIFFWRKRPWRFALFCLIFIALGVLRYSITIPDCEQTNELCHYNESSLMVEGVVAGEPNKKIDVNEYVIEARAARVNGNDVAVRGRFLVKLNIYPEYFYGDRLSISCRLASPKQLDTGTFRYDRYLARFNVWSVCYDPEAVLTGDSAGNKMFSGIYSFKKILNEKISSLWPEPGASLVAGILYGERSSLPKRLTEDFSRTGVSHIVAVSGYNITIIIVLMLGLFIAAGLYRQKAFYAVALFTFLFVVLAGLSASALRAAVMGIAVLVARQVGRGSRMFNVLVLTTALLAALNPYLLFWDVGFQLSILATIGLVYLSPLISKKIEIFPGIVREVLSTTLSAIIMTLPLMLYQFGTLSLVAPLVNVAILWIVPYLMLLSFISIALALFHPIAALPFSALTHFGISYVIMVVEYFGSISWSQVSFRVPFWLMILAYLAIFYGLYKYYEKNKSV